MKGSKKLINSPDTCVDEMLAGFVAAHPNLLLHHQKRVVQQRNWNPQQGKVGIISGGGSGHEPFCAGYVGQGMLAAIAAGSVFASPPASHVVHAIRCIAKDNPGGSLVIIPNYTGDCFNFGMAVMQAKNEGIKVEGYPVGEDCALLESSNVSESGRRGMCGLLFVYKICGSQAEQGASMHDLYQEAVNLTKHMATLGIGLSSCSLPGSGPLFTLEEDEMEVGLGVHGEAGIERRKICPADEIVKLILDRISRSLKLGGGEDVAVLINNLGSSSQIEQWLICGLVFRQLKERKINVCRIYAGHLMTSLDMAGVQVCVLKMPPEDKDRWLKCLDEPTDAPAWPGSSSSLPIEPESAAITSQDFISLSTVEIKVGGPTLNEDECKLMRTCLEKIAKALQAKEVKLNELDSGAGDGDCGSTFRRMADGIMNNMTNLNLARPATMFQQLAMIAESCMGGVSGGIYSLLCMAASNAIHNMVVMTPETWGQAWDAGLQSILSYSNAQVGDRTMIDAIFPAKDEYDAQPKTTWSQAVIAVAKAVDSAKDGCNRTKNMEAKVGRASYVEKSQLKEVDPGAYAVTIWLQAILETLQQDKFKSCKECPCSKGQQQ